MRVLSLSGLLLPSLLLLLLLPPSPSHAALVSSARGRRGRTTQRLSQRYRGDVEEDKKLKTLRDGVASSLRDGKAAEGYEAFKRNLHRDYVEEGSHEMNKQNANTNAAVKAGLKHFVPDHHSGSEGGGSAAAAGSEAEQQQQELADSTAGVKAGLSKLQHNQDLNYPGNGGETPSNPFNNNVPGGAANAADAKKK
jgi:hypothetical protein